MPDNNFSAVDTTNAQHHFHYYYPPINDNNNPTIVKATPAKQNNWPWIIAAVAAGIVISVLWKQPVSAQGAPDQYVNVPTTLPSASTTIETPKPQATVSINKVANDNGGVVVGGNNNTTNTTSHITNNYNITNNTHIHHNSVPVRVNNDVVLAGLQRRDLTKVRTECDDKSDQHQATVAKWKRDFVK